MNLICYTNSSQILFSIPKSTFFVSKPFFAPKTSLCYDNHFFCSGNHILLQKNFFAMKVIYSIQKYLVPLQKLASLPKIGLSSKNQPSHQNFNYSIHKSFCLQISIVPCKKKSARLLHDNNNNIPPDTL